MIEIESSVPFPDKGGLHPNTKYPFQALEVGQSFPVADRAPPTMRAIARHHAAQTGRTFKVRREGDGSRVWRTA